MLSGLSHSAFSWQLGSRYWYLDSWWFFLNFLGCFVETTLLSLLRRLANALGWSQELEDIEESWFRGFFGYSWTFGFFFWSVPKWKYPPLYVQAKNKEGWLLILSKTNVAKE